MSLSPMAVTFIILAATIALFVFSKLRADVVALMALLALYLTGVFLTPIASPTNTLVYAPGGYTWGDFAKSGLPLIVLTLVISLLVAPLVWPL